MNVSPQDIAQQRHHHDIVELLKDWPLGVPEPIKTLKKKN